ncbi:hypothetical protein EXIGLDRAFT_673222 [Exidia glandulosa HHB12029]|uniref:B box-type domain-containing protein n=1 Tax=Exidia glandulosa HHB12029 TaxID=1314781 RepID=A0A165J2Q7_EXIGL|nr:hypothetical protein EXIGLDRAFT_673222 [Exidia glandulosa HHB12029]
MATLTNGLKASLAKILDSHPDELHGEHDDEPIDNGDDAPTSRHVNPLACVECEDQPAQIRCDQCEDQFCEVCFHSQHRKGSRKGHTTTPVDGAKLARQAAQNGAVKPDSSSQMDVTPDAGDQEWVDDLAVPEGPLVLGPQPDENAPVGEWYTERAKYIPLRLTFNERKYLRLLDAALTVSEYTDRIDTLGYNISKVKRIVHQVKELCSILSGLVLAADYKQGQELFADRDFASNSEFYQTVFELGRRHKIMNPDKMRTTYGKLMYVLMDAQIPEVRDTLGFSCVSPLKTVHSILDAAGALDMLRDARIATATKEITSDASTSRRNIDKAIKLKERAIEQLATEYASPGLSVEQARQCIYSIGDNHAFLRANRDPCEKMIVYLKQYFTPSKPAEGRSLAIRSGRGGARLSHDHAQQYAYVIQSLTLWREILNDFFHLWNLAEQDLMSDRVIYRLRDTGQGLNRVQPAPKTSRAMHAILHRAQQSVGSWVGSSVIHMGDHNVPNALMFIDKYSQIYRILLPICTTLAQIPTLMDKPALKQYITSEFGSVEGAHLAILTDFFKHGFDGSGADNFFDAGSCIDGRLTSAWNWCSTIEKKKYFPLFLLTGFTSFDF